MLRFFCLISCVLIFCCQNNEDDRLKIARVFDDFLYLDQIPLPPDNLDSVIFVNNFINQWASQKLLVNKAEFNFKSHPTSIDTLVDLYRSSLLIHHYKQVLISSHLDTVIKDSLIKNYYQSNLENFNLKESVVKMNYIKIKKIAPNIEYVVNNYHSSDLNSLDGLEDYCLQFAEKFFLGDVNWMVWSDFLSELPVEDNPKLSNSHLVFRKENKIELEDSTYRYFIFIQDFKLKGTSSPLEYVSSLIKKILINKRKKELINSIEKDLFNDAINNNNFEIYD